MMNSAVSVFDVAKYILDKNDATTHLKLQKLVYYCQAWSLVWDDSRLFNERIEAWANGPVVPELYNQLAGSYQVSASQLEKGDRAKLSTSQQETVEAVLDFYGDKSSQWLSDLTHMEDPWQNAREGLSAGERGNQEITPAAMAEYYSALPSRN